MQVWVGPKDALNTVPLIGGAPNLRRRCAESRWRGTGTGDCAAAAVHAASPPPSRRHATAVCAAHADRVMRDPARLCAACGEAAAPRLERVGGGHTHGFTPSARVSQMHNMAPLQPQASALDPRHAQLKHHYQEYLTAEVAAWMH
eukprot:353023-Chlamydomonas_euryale.AAC.2